MTTSSEFRDHVAFVTGGASGIGEQICRDLAAEGASVVIADLHAQAAADLAASLPTGDGRSHLGLALDVSQRSQIESALARVLETYGRPADLIVNCAGMGGICPLEEISEEYFDRVMAVNFKGTFLVTQIFGKALLDANQPGSIANISSNVAYMPLAQASVYCASKAAVMQFTKVAAKEWGPRGIRVNSIHPGLIETPMTQQLKETPVWGDYIANASLRRAGTPKEVSNVVLFTLSNRSSYVTGSQLEVTGQPAS